MLTYNRFTSFEEVETKYKNTKPVREFKCGTMRDIRPVGDRSRKDERVHKFTDSCYGLFDGWWGDPCGWAARSVYYPDPNEITDHEARTLCPIVWRKHRDGSQTVTIRNGSGSGAHTSRYLFLERMLPRNMSFQIRQGKQFVWLHGEDYYLAKSSMYPKSVVEAWKNGKYGGRYSDTTYRDDGVSIRFRRSPDGVFTFDGGGKPRPKAPRVLVDKSKKAKYKKHIADFRDWVSAVGPMLPVGDWNYVSEKRNELQEFCKSKGHKFPAYSPRLDIPANIAIQILTDYNHSMRLNMAVNFLSQSDMRYKYSHNEQDQQDPNRVRAQFNRWANKTFGFQTVK